MSDYCPRIIGYAQPVVRLRTLDGVEIIRRIDKINRTPDEIYALDNGEFLYRGRNLDDG